MGAAQLPVRWPGGSKRRGPMPNDTIDRFDCAVAGLKFPGKMESQLGLS